MKMIQNTIKIAFVVLFTYSANAQQEGHFINQTNNPYLLNPAAGGMTSTAQFEATWRTQWLNYSGGPQSMILTGNSAIKTGGGKNVLQEFNVKDKALFQSPERTTGRIKHVVGGTIMNDVIGPFDRTSVQGSYAIHLPLIKSLNIGAGLSVGWSGFNVIQSRVKLYQEDDDQYSQFLGNSSSQNILNASAGLVLYNEDLYVGISSSQILNNNVVFDNVETGSNYNRHFYFMGKYTLDAGTQFEVEPTAVIKLVQNSPIGIDVGARFVYNKSMWIGLQYRTSNAITIQFGANIIKNLYVSYGYEHGIGAIKTASNGTHEIQLGFYLGNKRNIKKELKNSEEKTEE